jgi:hypothetical protein
MLRLVQPGFLSSSRTSYFLLETCLIIDFIAWQGHLRMTTLPQILPIPAFSYRGTFLPHIFRCQKFLIRDQRLVVKIESGFAMKLGFDECLNSNGFVLELPLKIGAIAFI